MADPLFVTDLATMKMELRLSGIDSTADVDRQLKSAIQEVRVGFYSRLGLTRTNELAAIAYVENPTTEDPILRAIAYQTEVKWVWCALSARLPMLFMDGSAGDRQFINEEGTFREVDPGELQRERDNAKAQIDEWLCLLSGDCELGDGDGANVYLPGAQTPRIWPFGTLVSENPRLFGDPTRDIPETTS